MDWKFEKGRIYSADKDGNTLAEVTYVMQENGEANIDHTYVSPSLRGKGVAGDLMKTIAQYFRDKAIKTTAQCSYANAWLKRHCAVYSDIISDDLKDQAPGCKIK